MDKWADYLISEVSYDANHLISVAIRHKDTNKGITKGIPVDRLTISSDIKNGISYITIYSGKNSWKKGHQIRTFSIDGEPFLRIDGNKVELDSLGDLSVVTSIDLDELDLAPEPVADEPIPEPAPPSPRGSLPKESAEELPQELDLSPEPVADKPIPEPEEEEEATPEQLARLEQLEKQIQELESQPEPEEEEEATPEQLARLEQLEKQIQELESQPEPEEEEEATPEQLARLEQLEKQIQELESQPEPAPPSPRGSLPKESAEELPQELDLSPEPVADKPIPEPEEEEEATPEQLARLEQLEKQIQELESQPEPEEEEEATPEQLQSRQFFQYSLVCV